MKNLDSISKTINPLFKNFLNKCSSHVIKKHSNNLSDSSEIVLPVTKYFEDKVWAILSSNENISQGIDSAMRWFKRYIKKIDLTDDENQRLLFEELKKFLNNFWFILRRKSRYLENTLSPNKVEFFNEKSIWEKIDDIIAKDNYLDDPNYWSSCRHYTLLFKDFFDQLENLWLNITNYLFVENTDWSDHMGLVVTFKWENFLVDSFLDLRKRLVVHSFKDLPKNYFDRMKTLENFSKDDINDDNLWSNIEKYKNGNLNYRKVCFKNTDDLFQLLSSIMKDKWAISFGRFEKKNLLDLFMWTHFNIFRDWILFSRTFFYHFDDDKMFDEQTLCDIPDEDLLKEMVNRISYKTENGKSTKIEVFDFEKKHLLSRLLYFSKKIDYSHLREILNGFKTI